MRCPDDNTLAELLAAPSDDDARRELLGHLDTCAACRTLVADAVAVEADAGDAGALGRGDTIGRYVIDRVLGGGAMGVVYAARDPKLARDIALKILRPGAADPGALLHEARTVARLAHPNVIAIYDASSDGGRLVIAMELVDGVTLRSWLAARPRSWPELRDVFTQAARGLATAHAAGIIHRDIKPDNLLIGRDGRVRVTDFGLARPAHAREIAGTPAYMSPEQRAGRAVDARSDLYALCVVVFEALYDRRPEPDEPIPALRRDLPGRVRAALAAGLRADPDHRPADLAPLLDAMAPKRSPAIIFAVASAAAAALVTAAFLIHARNATEPCSDGATAWPAVWPDRDAARAAFHASKIATADAAFTSVDDELARYRAGWIDTRRATCLATAHGTQSADLLDRRMACLEQSRGEATAIIAVLAAADRAVVARAAEQVRGLRPPASCASAATDGLVLRPPQAAAALDALDARLATARALQGLGKRAACAATIAPLVDEAHRVGYQPLIARIHYIRARCESDDDAIAEDLQTAATAATAGHDDETLAWAWARLMYLEGFIHHDFAKAALWERYTRAVLDRGTVANPRVTLGYYNNAALVRQAEGKYDDARAMLAQRRALLVASYGEHSPELASQEQAIAITYLDGWRYDEALDHLRSAAALIDPQASILERINLLENTASALRGVGRAHEALAIFPQLFALIDEFDPDGDNSFARRIYGDVLLEDGDPTRALVEHRRACAICEQYHGASGYRCADPWLGVAGDLVALGRLDEAATAAQRALELYGKEPEPYAEFVLAEALIRRDPARARQLAAHTAARLRDLVEHGHANRRSLDEVEAWQHNHPE